MCIRIERKTAMVMLKRSRSRNKPALKWIVAALFVFTTVAWMVGAEDETLVNDLKLRANRNYESANMKNTIAGKKNMKKIIAMKQGKIPSSTPSDAEEEEVKKPVENYTGTIDPGKKEVKLILKNEYYKRRYRRPIGGLR